MNETNHAVAPTTPVAVKLESSDIAIVAICRMSIPRSNRLSLGRSFMGDIIK
jgi:hypothetical protein